MDDRLTRVWEIIEKTPVCMLTTRSVQGLRARPMEPRPDRAAGLILFITDARSGKEDEIAAEHDVGLTFIVKSENVYLSIAGRASVLHDVARQSAIWKATDNAWWPGGPEDTNARLLCVVPATAEIWDGPASKAAATFEFAKARLTGQKPNLGENRHVTVPMR